MLPPQFLEVPSSGDWVCQLDKSLYGLKDAPRMLYEKLRKELSLIGFQELQHAKCVFKRGETFILVYVDDLLIVTPDENEFSSIKRDLSSSMPTQDLGPINHFLGIDVITKKGSVILKQSKGIEALVSQAQKTNCRNITTPLEFTLDYTTSEGKSASNNLPYRSLIGSLLYLATETRPDLAVAVSMLAHHVTSLTYLHQKGVVRILKYLN